MRKSTLRWKISDNSCSIADKRIKLTLSLLTLIGTSTVVVVKAELEQSQKPTPDSVITSQEADAADAAEPPTTEAEYLEEPQSELNTIEDEKQKAEAGAEPEPEAEQSVPAE